MRFIDTMKEDTHEIHRSHSWLEEIKGVLLGLSIGSNIITEKEKLNDMCKNIDFMIRQITTLYEKRAGEKRS